MEEHKPEQPLRTDTVSDARMDTMVLLANMRLRKPDAFPPTEVLQARDICRLVSTVRKKDRENAMLRAMLDRWLSNHDCYSDTGCDLCVDTRDALASGEGA